MKSSVLIKDLNTEIEQQLQRLAAIDQYDQHALNFTPSDDQWSALECIEHLNLYGDYYLEAIDQAIRNSPYEPKGTYRPGWIGNYFAQSMKPRNRPLKTFEDKNPSNSDLSREAIDRFQGQLKTMQNLLDRAKNVDINRTRVPISITRWIRFKLGDIFRVVINHNQRHLAQAEKMLTARPS
jgi:hypothetical protein